MTDDPATQPGIGEMFTKFIEGPAPLPGQTVHTFRPDVPDDPDVDEQLAAAQAELEQLRGALRRSMRLALVAMVGAGGSIVLQLARVAGFVP